MKSKPPKGDKREIRQETHLTRPPRMEGKIKEAMMQPMRKKSRTSKKVTFSKPQGYTDK